jgi:hypothetical protein
MHTIFEKKKDGNPVPAAKLTYDGPALRSRDHSRSCFCQVSVRLAAKRSNSFAKICQQLEKKNEKFTAMRASVHPRYQ